MKVAPKPINTYNPLKPPPPPNPMPPHLTPLDNDFAFEVQGLDIWSGLDDAQVRTPDDAWANQGVLVFRRQALTEGELDDVAREWFGRR